MSDTIIKNQIYECTIDGWNSEGLGVARINGKTVFIPETIPGEEWEIRIVKNLTSYAYGKREKCLKASPERIQPDCGYFPKCGGCSLRHMTYEKELEFKLNKVNDAYKHIAGMNLVASHIVGSNNTDHYRNKAIYAINENLQPGFYRPRTHDVIPVDNCHLQQTASDIVAHAICDFCRNNGFEAYNENNNKGTIRHVFTRVSHSSGKMQVTVVAARGFGDKTEKLVEEILHACPETESIVLNVNKSTGNTILTGKFYTLWGKSVITDSLCGINYELSAASFFQINPAQAERLYSIAVEYAAPDKERTVLDLYCGAGTISLFVAKKAKQVFGVEIVPEAIENAERNALNNQSRNVEFLCSDAGDAAEMLRTRNIRIDSVIVDPPRKGLSNEVISAVSAMNPERIVYISCNVSTQARDIKLFSEQGYLPKTAVAVDMFPRTPHVECVCLLETRQ